MRFEIITIFPGFFAGIFEHGIVRRAQAEGLVSVGVHDLRAFTHDRHRTVDDRPFGGGEGMVLKPEPLAEALGSLGILPKDRGQGNEGTGRQGTREQGNEGTRERKRVLRSGEENRSAQDDSTRSGTPIQDDGDRSGTRVILMSAQGRRFTQAVARELATLERVALICGRYEGVDERINELYCDMELSIGDYVLSGGELAAAVVVDTVMRLVPGVLGNEASGEFESFGVADAEIETDEDGVPRSQHGAGGLLDYPHYTRPAEFCGLRAPEVLLNGDHQQIRRWRREQQLRKTLRNRPDLIEDAERLGELSQEDLAFLNDLRGAQILQGESGRD